MHVNCTRQKIIFRENPGGFCTDLHSFLVMNNNSYQMHGTRFLEEKWESQTQQHEQSCLHGADRSFSISQGLRCRNTVKTTFCHFVDGNAGESGGTDRFWSWRGGVASSTTRAQWWMIHLCVYSCFHVSRNIKQTRAIPMTDLTPEMYNSFGYCWKRFLRK